MSPTPTMTQASIPQCFQAGLNIQASREERNGFLIDLIAAEVLPRLPVDHRVLWLHIGANRCHLTHRLADDFMCTHAIEPNTYQLPQQPDELEGLAVHTEDLMVAKLGRGVERFAFVLCDHLLNSLAVSPARADPQAWLGRVVELLQEGGMALLGTLAPRGPLHDFLSSVNPAYVGSPAVMSVLQDMPGVQAWVVERSNVASLPSATQLEQLLQLHAYLARQLCQAQPADPGLEAPAPAPAPAPAGPEPVPAADTAGAEGMDISSGGGGTGGGELVAGVLEEGAMAERIREFVGEAFDGEGRWNWVEEDDYVLVLKLPQQAVGKV